MSLFVKMGKKAKRILKNAVGGAQTPVMSRVRRIERVATKERVVAMTFDDGPFALPCNPDHFEGRCLTDVLLDTLKEFGAKGTFDVVGDTSENYPDDEGKLGSPQWGGVAYDHYPDIRRDEQGGAVHQGDLIRRILSEGHELSNHGYRHIIFGRKPFVYGKRRSLSSLTAVMEDLSRLHHFIQTEYDYTMTLSRPPHYVDLISPGLSSYDAYALMGYQYMAASFDGAGWLPKGSYEAEVDDMVLPMKRLLEGNSDGLCGQIIFQKDGYNMMKRTPVADGLRKQLELLTEYGYRVVPVSELLNLAQLNDVDADSPYFDYLNQELKKGACVAYRDNSFRSERVLTRGELAMFLSAPTAEKKRTDLVVQNPKQMAFSDMPVTHPYAAAAMDAAAKGLIEPVQGKFLPDRPVNKQLLRKVLKEAYDIETDALQEPITRGYFITILMGREKGLSV